MLASRTQPRPAATPSDAAYPEIDDYAVIGDCRTVALVSREGSIDWLCLPHFSSPSVFAALLDRERGGRFALDARDVVERARRYVPRTNVLETTLRCRTGVLRRHDFMAVAPEAALSSLRPQHELVRIVECLEGEVEIEAAFEPRPGYGRIVPRLRRRGALGWWCQERGMALCLASDLDWVQASPGRLTARTRLRAGERRALVLSHTDGQVAVVSAPDAAAARLEETLSWWRGWAERCDYRGPYRDAVVRSCLVLKLLTYCVTGALVAAATTSLPEGETGDRNWDYRYCWLRDASLVLHAFGDVGYDAESRAFLNWLLHATHAWRPELHVLYDVHGEHSLPERELHWLEGWRGLGPVRIGNGAHDQRQLDIFGEVVLTAYEHVCEGGRLDAAERRLLAEIGRIVERVWRERDYGIWEVRTQPRHNTHSKLMCWVALDRLARMARAGLVDLPEPRLLAERDRIRDDIEAHAFDARLDSYVGYYGGSAPDASLLLMPRYGYLDANDPRMRGTVRRIERELAVAGCEGLLYRYPPGGGYDGVAGDEAGFFICGFWLAEYHARAGDPSRARRIFERLLALGSDLGLFAEEHHGGLGAARGNFPQAFSHVGLINAAGAIEAAERGERPCGTRPDGALCAAAVGGAR